jgi:4-amino-4-deoxy-L-arabinose transferase-like glycosyltransferase
VENPLPKQPSDRLSWLLIGLAVLFAVLYPLTLRNADIETDEAWLGQQVQALFSTGQVSSDLFRDVPPLDHTIVVYHKLLIWLGAGASWLFGWGITQLRLISTLAGVLLVLLVGLSGSTDSDRRTRWLAAALLLFTPLFGSYLRMFRPEMLMVLLGWGSFLLLRRADASDNHTLMPIAAGMLAGLAGLTHAIGLAFVAAGIIPLAIERKGRETGLFTISALLLFSPYLSGLVSDPDLFGRQLFANAFTDARLTLEWWQPINNLFHEHTRLFRKPEVIGLSVAMVLALLLFTREQWRKDRFTLVYLATLVALGGMAPLPKITRYMLPLTPCFALLVSRAWYNSASVRGYRRAVRQILSGWLIVFFLYGAYALGALAFARTGHQVDTNRDLATKIEPGAVVMAPFDFVFHGPSPIVVQSWWGCEKAAHQQPTVPQVEQYAISTGVQYLILDSLRMQKLQLTPEQIPSAFRSFAPLLLLPDQQRYLLRRQP